MDFDFIKVGERLDKEGRLFTIRVLHADLEKPELQEFINARAGSFWNAKDLNPLDEDGNPTQTDDM